MATNGGAEDGRLPPPTEEVHLPGPSYLPVIVAAGITLVVIGVVLSPYLLMGGVLMFLVATVRWIRETREDMAELPLEH